MTDLRSCPFCGCRNAAYRPYDPFDGYQGNCLRHEIRCPRCGASIGGKNEKDVHDKWNTRKEITNA